MSVRNGFVLLLAFSALLFLAACGGSGNSVTNPVPPPSGSFSNSNLNGTYVFSVSGTDVNGFAYAMVGTLTADGSGGNGKGNITGGTVDMADGEFSAPFANAPISASTYSIGVDGRGTAVLSVSNNPFGSNLTLDFVLQDSSHGLITEFDGNATGSGTIDVQTAGTTPNGSYAFSLSGAGPSGAFATVGNFAVGAGGAISGLEDLNSGGIVYPDQVLSGNVVLGPSSTPATTLTTSAALGTLTFDVFAIDATHLKFIEMDATGTLVGDAFSQTTTTVPAGTLPFTLSGFLAGNTPFAAGGFMVTDGAGNITIASTEDINAGGTTVSAAPVQFTANYGADPNDPANSGRVLLTNFSGFTGGTEFAAYPSTGGTLLLEIDSTLGILAGVAYRPQSTTSFSAGQGYAFNFTGVNLAINSGVEVDDLAEFAANSSGTTVTGVIDENFQPGGGPNFGMALSGTYSAPDSNGRGQIAANAGNSSNSTLNGGFAITFYTVDGTTFPFIETDANGQVASGVFVEQNPAAASSAVKAPNMFIPQPLVRAHAAKQKNK